MIAHVVTTSDKAAALRLPARECAELWRKQSGHLRPDGRPDRPLTAFTVAIEPADEPEADSVVTEQLIATQKRLVADRLSAPIVDVAEWLSGTPLGDNCPRCGGPPLPIDIDLDRQRFCASVDCQVFCWDPTDTREQFEASAQIVDGLDGSPS